MVLVYSFVFGLVCFSVCQKYILPCGDSCREAYIRNSVKNLKLKNDTENKICNRIEELKIHDKI